MMPANSRLVARELTRAKSKHATSLRQKALTFWRLRDARHYNALLSEKPKYSRILMLVVGASRLFCQLLQQNKAPRLSADEN